MSMRAWYIASVVVHILAAMTWIGGMIFLVLVLVPALRTLPSREMAVELVASSGRRFRTIGWISLGALVATGCSNLYCRGIGWSQLRLASFWDTPFGQTLALKLTLVGVILLTSLLHDFRVGPRASQAMRDSPGSPTAVRQRLLAAWMGRVNLLLSIIVLVLGVMLVRGRPW